ncbi:MAG: DUF2890 domain-containing protein [Deltaproteobacteria bacterium]|nr:MAG: DUF2890 domain-containing protein [Deltaproteobacteria bacterium]
MGCTPAGRSQGPDPRAGTPARAFPRRAGTRSGATQAPPRHPPAIPVSHHARRWACAAPSTAGLRQGRGRRPALDTLPSTWYCAFRRSGLRREAAGEHDGFHGAQGAAL